MRWLSFVPAGLLVAVATTQLVLAHVSDLSPWVGGGFGMFASTDGRGFRHLHIVELHPGLEREVFPSEDLADHVRRARSFPSDGSLRALALALDARPGSTIRVEIWRTSFDAETLLPEQRLMRGLSVPIGDGS